MSTDATAHVATTRVWDLVVRAGHWCVAGLMALAWFTGGMSGELHEWLGLLPLVLVMLRLAWGFVGPRHARFRQFLHGPRATWAYARDVWGHRAPRHVGHNPLGGWMVVALLVGVGCTALTGWLYTTDWLWGYAWLDQLHATLAWGTLGLVVLHVAGVLHSSLAHRENLVAAMWHGRKRVAQPPDVD